MELGGLGLTALRLKHLFKLDLLTANSNAALTCYDNLKILDDAGASEQLGLGILPLCTSNLNLAVVTTYVAVYL